MLDDPTAAIDAESKDEAQTPEPEDHPGADTLNVPTFDDAGYLRWSHTEPKDENAA